MVALLGPQRAWLLSMLRFPAVSGELAVTLSAVCQDLNVLYRTGLVGGSAPDGVCCTAHPTLLAQARD